MELGKVMDGFFYVSPKAIECCRLATSRSFKVKNTQSGKIVETWILKDTDTGFK